MKTSDYIAQLLAKSVDAVFGVTGGNIINVVDSFKRAGVNVVSMHHEQSAAIAADAYARLRGLGVCYSTSGPGVTNLLTGTCCSYYDSVPVLALGGQVPSPFLDGPDRQMGFQEADGVAIFKPVTKMSRRYMNGNDLEVCIQAAKQPRMGPVFLEIPDDIQRSQIEPMQQKSIMVKSYRKIDLPDLSRFKRPLLILGQGCVDAQLEIEIPFLYTWRTKDKFYNHKWCKGGFGITGGAHGNQLLKEADAVVMVGTRIDSHQAPRWDRFAPNAIRIAIGLEFPHWVDEYVNCSLQYASLSISGPNWCQRIEDLPDGPAYKWIDSMCDDSGPDDVIIPDMGQIGCIAFQRWKIKGHQRLFNGINHSPMGYSLPGAIGAAIATGRKVIVIVGDGSLMMNLQDLQTISALKLPINIFVVNNGGYGMIRQTQDDWKEFLLQGVGCNFAIPDIRKLADAFGLVYSEKISDQTSIGEIKIENTKITPKWRYGSEL